MLSTDNASFKAKNIRAGSPDLFMSMLYIAHVLSTFDNNKDYVDIENVYTWVVTAFYSPEPDELGLMIK